MVQKQTVEKQSEKRNNGKREIRSGAGFSAAIKGTVKKR
jgi:hypothetical protein